MTPKHNALPHTVTNKTVLITGSALLGALVVVLDYSFKYSGLKIRFPWLPFLKFDFTGVPIVLSFLIFGFFSSIFTSAVALFAIFARSGDFLGASMKALAEFSTVLGVAFAFKFIPKFKQFSAFTFGILFRCMIMFFANLLFFPISISPLIAAFNVIQGIISISLGFFVFKATERKIFTNS